LLSGIIRPLEVRRLGAAFTPESTPLADPPPKRVDGVSPFVRRIVVLSFPTLRGKNSKKQSVLFFSPLLSYEQ
jgi:hypothetical protein